MNESKLETFPAEKLVHVKGHTKTWNENWRQLYDEFRDVVIAYSRRRGLDENSADDVLQEVMSTVIASQHGMVKGYDPGKGNFKAWLWGVINHRVREVRRRASKTPPLPQPKKEDEEPQDDGRYGAVEPPDYARLEEETWQHAILDAAVKRAEARVGQEQFAIFLALLKEEASPMELAERTGRTRNNIDAIKHQCKEMVITEATRILREWELLRQDTTNL